MSHDATRPGTDDLRDALIRSGNSYIELHARSGADGRVAPQAASRAFETAQWVAIDESWSIIATIVDIA
jgi:hypothetical protein